MPSAPTKPRPEFDLGEPFLTQELFVNSQDVYRIPGKPLNDAARQLVARMGGAVPSALLMVDPQKGLTDDDRQKARQRISDLVDQAVKDGLA